MYFDDSISNEGDSVGIWIIYANRDFKVYSYKLTFEFTNNVAEYEALVLGLNTLKYFKSKIIDGLGDSELVMNKVNDSYQSKYPIMRAYINEVWETILSSIQS